ncbi:MAG: hypothetical protein K2G93_08650 [Rikenella sp.]|nr:hypothetical protein [Rikenella sp.]
MGAAPGYRGRSDGLLYNVGNAGYNWASTVAGSNAYYLDLLPDRIYPNYYSGRANGLQTRCLQE